MLEVLQRVQNKAQVECEVCHGAKVVPVRDCCDAEIVVNGDTTYCKECNEVCEPIDCPVCQ
jgi:hypothetical protein